MEKRDCNKCKLILALTTMIEEKNKQIAVLKKKTLMIEQLTRVEDYQLN